MVELLHRDLSHRLIGLCMEIHRELGKGHSEVVHKDGLCLELSRAGIPYAREKQYEIIHKGVVLAHPYYADFVVGEVIIVASKVVESLTESHVRQVLNYVAALKLRLGVLINFGADSLDWKRVVL